MQRGDIVVVDLGTGVGSEAKGRRPAIVVSNEEINQRARYMSNQVVTVVPVTSNTQRIYQFQVLLRGNRNGLRTDSKAQAEQIRAIAARRIEKVIGQLPPELVDQLDAAIRMHLQLWPSGPGFPSDT